MVTATLFSNLIKEGVTAIDLITKNIENSIDIDYIHKAVAAIKVINDVISKANTNAIKEYCKCSTYVKAGAITIAHRESQIIKKAIMNKGEKYLINDLRHYNKSVIDMTKIILAATKSIHNTDVIQHCTHLSEQLATVRPGNSQTINTTRSIVNRSTTNNRKQKPPQIKHPIKSFCLPPPILNDDMYSPMQAILFVNNNTCKDKKIIRDLPKVDGKYMVRKMTPYIIIKALIQKKYIPITISPMYNMIAAYKEDKSSVPIWWHNETTAGPKHHLSLSKLNELSQSMHKLTEGGRAMSKDDLKNELSVSIISEREKATGNKYTHDVVPETTLRRYVNEVITEIDFNIFGSVSNKTESRSVAEFSIRSTISFLLVLLTSHFIRAVPTKFHKPKKEMEKNETWQLVHKLNSKILGVTDSLSVLDQFIHVLPHLITSTDECSLFITTQIINNKLAWYFSTRPKVENSPTEDSNKRDLFTNTLSGDAHMRGVRISLNNTFTAGGRSAPIFACIYGLSMAEMPMDEIVVCEIEGLVPASNQNGSKEIGFIVFIRGSDPTNEPIIKDTGDVSIDPETYYSKDAKVAKIYREKVYYPLIKDIRENYYMMPEQTEEDDIPAAYTAVSWMDGCHGQLSLITKEKVLDHEKNLKIISCKHSAARTAMEQPADAGPMFKTMKGVIKKMPTESITISPIFFRITEALTQLESPSSIDDTKVVKLPTHKKKSNNRRY